MESLTVTSGKRGKGKRKSSLPNVEKFMMTYFARLMWCVFGLLTLFILFFTFKRYYYKHNDRFNVAPTAIKLLGSTTYSLKYFQETFELQSPQNGFDLVQSDIVTRIQERMPIYKDVSMTYTQGGEVLLKVEERTPLAKLSGNGRQQLFVDDEGMVFVYPRGGKFPEIGGFDMPEELLPGNRLPESLHCMLRFLSVVSDSSETFNSSIDRIRLLGMDADDGLRVTLNDGRVIEIAWENMASEKEISEGMMKRIKNLSKVLKSDVAKEKKFFNAMAPDRIAVTE